jgi:two-component system alkaline phosphatase synthesis response regulator PhoP
MRWEVRCGIVRIRLERGCPAGALWEPVMSRKILVVDDNLDSIMILRSILETNGFSVRVAQSGPEALEQLKHELPDLMLLDVMMPQMSGIEVLERVKSTHATSKVPVIMVTAKVQDEDMLTGYQHGADYYITKPCTAKQLLYGIGLVLDRLAPSSEASPAREAEDEAV